MDTKEEIAREVAKLPPAAQEQVLRFVASLAQSGPIGEDGAALRPFSGILNASAAREMIDAVEEGCEQIDPGDW